MRPAMLFLAMVIAMAFVGAGIYGFVHDLSFWLIPMLLGLIIAGGVIDQVNVKP